MDTKIDFDIIQGASNQKQNLLLQLLSGCGKDGQFSMGVLSDLCAVYGTIEVRHNLYKSRKRTVQYICSIRDAQKTAVLPISESFIGNNVPSYLKVLKGNTIRATQFSHSHPIESINVHVIQAVYIDQNPEKQSAKLLSSNIISTTTSCVNSAANSPNKRTPKRNFSNSKSNSSKIKIDGITASSPPEYLPNNQSDSSSVRSSQQDFLEDINHRILGFNTMGSPLQEKNVVLLKYSVNFRSPEKILFPRSSTWRDYQALEVTMDKITLLRARVQLPRRESINHFGIAVNTSGENSGNSFEYAVGIEKELSLPTEALAATPIRMQTQRNAAVFTPERRSRQLRAQEHLNSSSAAASQDDALDRSFSSRVSSSRVSSSSADDPLFGERTLLPIQQQQPDPPSGFWDPYTEVFVDALISCCCWLRIATFPFSALLSLVRQLRIKPSEIFLLILATLVWLIARASLQDSVHYKLFLEASLVLSSVAAVVVITARGAAQSILRLLFQVPTCNERTFFINGWNAWSYCGCVLQGKRPPRPSLPEMFVRSFHDGGVGTAHRINLGYIADPLLSAAEEALTGAQATTAGDWGWLQAASTADSADAESYRASIRDYAASDMFTLLADNRNKCGVVVGFLTQHQQFGCIATNQQYDQLTVHVSGDGVVVSPTAATTTAATATSNADDGALDTDWLAFYIVDNLFDPFQIYMQMSSIQNEVEQFFEGSSAEWPSKFSFSSTTNLARDYAHHAHFPEVSMPVKVPAGWCSWYHYYENITEEKLKSNLYRMSALRGLLGLNSPQKAFNLFQVDDGYQAAWGDWSIIDQKKFPSATLFNVVKEIRAMEMTAGLWFAPFSCDIRSQTAAGNYDWVLKPNPISTSWWPCNSAFCGKFFRCLDVTNPEVQEHIKQTVEVATKVWGFNYLKMDFLYSAVPHDSTNRSFYNRNLTRAQIMQLAMKTVTDEVAHQDHKAAFAIGQEVKPTYLLGCGAPLGSVIGRVHANRVSADAGLTWNPEFPLPANDKYNLPCARNMVRNTLTRLFMHRHWWVNDPDCIMLRDSLSFTDDEIRGIATAKALSGGSFIISDNFQEISAKRCRIAQQLLPPTDVAAVALDLFEREMPEVFRLNLQSTYTDRIMRMPSFKEESCFDTSKREVYPLSRIPTGDDFADGVDAFEDTAGVAGDYRSLRGTKKMASLSTGNLHELSLRSSSSGHAADSEDNIRQFADIGMMVNPSQDDSFYRSPSDTPMDDFDSASYSRKINAMVQLQQVHDESDSGSNDSDDEELVNNISASDLKLKLQKASFRAEQRDKIATSGIPLSKAQTSFDTTAIDEDIPPLQMYSRGNTNQSVESLGTVDIGLHSTVSPTIRNILFRRQEEVLREQRRHSSDINATTAATGGGEVDHCAVPGVAELQLSQQEQRLRSHSDTQLPPTTDTAAAGSNQGINSRGKRESTAHRTREHLRARAFMFDLSKDLRKLQREADAVKKYLREENEMNEKDLIGHWVVFTVCNWGEAAVKSHFLRAKDLFGEEIVQQLVSKNMLVDNWIRVKRSTTSSLSQKLHLKLLQRQTSCLKENPRYLLHMFNFWTETYSCKLVTLKDDEDSEVAFTGIPRHSAHIYSVSLTTDPTLPKYIGSNLHFSCGTEVYRSFISKETPPASHDILSRIARAIPDGSIELQPAPLLQNAATVAAVDSTSNVAVDAATATTAADDGVTISIRRGIKFKPPMPTIKVQSRQCSFDLESPPKTSKQATATAIGAFTSASTDAGAVVGAAFAAEEAAADSELPVNISQQDSFHLSHDSETQQRRPLLPVIRSMCIVFEDGMLHSQDWGGFIWVFLPVNGLNTELNLQVVGHVDIQGPSAVYQDRSYDVKSIFRSTPLLSPRLFRSEFDPSSSDATSVVDSIGMTATTAAAAGAAVAGDHGKYCWSPTATPYLHKRISAPECRLAGGVYKIPVRAALDAQQRQSTTTNQQQQQQHQQKKNLSTEAKLSQMPLGSFSMDHEFAATAAAVGIEKKLNTKAMEQRKEDHHHSNYSNSNSKRSDATDGAAALKFDTSSWSMDSMTDDVGTATQHKDSIIISWIYDVHE